VDAVPFFVNDPASEDVSESVAESSIHELLRALRKIKSVGRPIVIGAQEGMGRMTFTSARRLISSFDVGKDWWRLLMQIDHHSPCASVPQCVAPKDGIHDAVVPHEVAPMWALANDAFVLSFPLNDRLRNPEVSVGPCACVDGAHVSPGDTYRNISGALHVDHWQGAILDYSYTESSNSVIYEGAGYRVRMYLNDHNPPHVHVYKMDNVKLCVGKVRVDKVEVLEDRGMGSSIRRSVVSIISERKEDFIRAWDRCRSGRLPTRIQ